MFAANSEFNLVVPRKPDGRSIQVAPTGIGGAGLRPGLWLLNEVAFECLLGSEAATPLVGR
jgi:hypothetical protein